MSVISNDISDDKFVENHVLLYLVVHFFKQF